MIHNYYVLIFICIAATSLHAFLRRDARDIASDPRTLNYLRSGKERPALRITNELNDYEDNVFDNRKAGKKIPHKDGDAIINVVTPRPGRLRKLFNENLLADITEISNNDGIVKRARNNDEETALYHKINFHRDPVLNFLKGLAFRRKSEKEKNKKKKKEKKSGELSSSSYSDASSLELRPWKEEWQEYWIKKKMEALNNSLPLGDAINMVAARPWGAPCGDPGRHDMPWGTCTLPQECDPEYRVYRGDYFCGRTGFICCAIQTTTYDTYHGLDATFEDKSLSTDVEEAKNRLSNDKKKNSKKQKRKRERDRKKRKETIRKRIRKLLNEIRKVLREMDRNSTKLKRKDTKRLKKFVKQMKKQYKHDREAMKNVHLERMILIDGALLKRINDIRMLNKNFMKNETFRNIVLTGQMSMKGARMLMEAYPELVDALHLRRMADLKDYMDYDIEYGFPI